MDAQQFDTLTRALITAGGRRRLLGLLAALPLLGGLGALLDDPGEVEAKGRRKRRKKGQHERNLTAEKRKKRKHKNKNKNKNKNKKKTCKPNSTAITCAEKCGTVQNNCQKPVDCGSCACEPPCLGCKICDESSGQCVPDPDKAGSDCGEPGQACQADGACACDDGSCGPCESCQENGLCSAPCNGNGCCDLEFALQCKPGIEDFFCGSGGNACQTCTPQEICGGGGTPGVCGCIRNDPCTEGVCGTVFNSCNEQIDCGGCDGATPHCVNHTCLACTEDDHCQGGEVCCDGSCFSGVCCGDAECEPLGGNSCVDHQCQCGAGGVCSGESEACCGSPGDCTDTQTDVDHCGECGNACGANERCRNGVCVCGDVGPGCQFDFVQEAINAASPGDEIRVCAGTFTGNVTIDKTLSIVGAGQGADPNTDTILQGEPNIITPSVVTIAGDGSVLRRLRITGGDATLNGGGLANSGSATSLSNCTIIGNTATENGGGIYNAGELTLDDCTVTENATDNFGAGIANFGTLNLTGGEISANTGKTTEFGVDGGGMYDAPGATSTMSNCTIRDNRATLGAGIYSHESTTEVSGSAFQGNNALSMGGGLYIAVNTTVDLTGCTITFNQAVDNGGGILNGGTVLCSESSVTGNFVAGQPNDCSDVGGAGCGSCSA